MSNISGEYLKQYIERIERLEEEKDGITSDIKDVYLDAKSNGFEPKIMKALVKQRKKDAAEIEEEETLLDLYKSALEQA